MWNIGPAHLGTIFWKRASDLRVQTMLLPVSDGGPKPSDLSAGDLTEIQHPALELG
jgi:hypothetical protein